MMSEFLDTVISIWQILYDCFKGLLYKLTYDWYCRLLHTCGSSLDAHIANDAVKLARAGWELLISPVFIFLEAKNVQRNVLHYIIKWPQGETFFDIGYI